MTYRSLLADIQQLGVRNGDVVMVHAGLRSVGPMIGGADTLIRALLAAVGEGGTVAAYVDFEPFFEEDDNPEDIPVFDKRVARAARDHGVLHEAMRTWPGAMRSDHPDAGVVAIGAKAAWLTAEHPFQYGYGEGSPFERIVETGGRVLMIGAPLDTITLLHYAEHKAVIPDKRVVTYRRRMAESEWVEFEEFDTSEPVSDRFPENAFEIIATEFLAAGGGVQGRIGQADSYLFESGPLVEFGIGWMERYP